MATFQIHEDIENVNKKEHDSNQIGLVPEVYKKGNVRGRSALQTVNNVIKQNAKRAKFCMQTNQLVPVISIKTVQPTSEENTVDSKENNFECVKLTRKDDAAPVILPKNLEDEKEFFSLDLLYNTEYRYDIWCYWKESEGKHDYPKPNYMRKQKHLDAGMRCVLVDWLVAVAEEYKLSDESLHLAVNYLDRFLSKMSVVRDKFQLLGSVAMMVAGKMEEIYPPDIKEWIYLSSGIYSGQQITRMEQLLLKVLKFDMQPPTVLSFIKLFCTEHKMDDKTLHLSMYFSELILLEGEGYLQYLPSKLAAASIALARLTLAKEQPWPAKLESSSGYTLKQLSPVVQKQNESFKDSPSKAQQSVQTKYRTSKYHKVALLQPRCLTENFFEEE